MSKNFGNLKIVLQISFLHRVVHTDISFSRHNSALLKLDLMLDDPNSNSNLQGIRIMILANLQIIRINESKFPERAASMTKSCSLSLHVIPILFRRIFTQTSAAEPLLQHQMFAGKCVDRKFSSENQFLYSLMARGKL